MRLFTTKKQIFLVLEPDKIIQGISKEQMESYFLISAKELQGKIYSKRQLSNDSFAVDEQYTKYSRHYLLNGVEYVQFGKLQLCDNGNYKIVTCDIQRLGTMNEKEFIPKQEAFSTLSEVTSEKQIEASKKQINEEKVEVSPNRELLKNQSSEVLLLWAEICQRLDTLVLYEKAVPLYSKSALKALGVDERPSTYICEDNGYFKVTDCLKKSRDFTNLISARLYIMLPSCENILMEKIEEFDVLEDGKEKLESFFAIKRAEIEPNLFRRICINLELKSLLESTENKI